MTDFNELVDTDPLRLRDIAIDLENRVETARTLLSSHEEMDPEELLELVRDALNGEVILFDAGGERP